MEEQNKLLTKILEAAGFSALNSETIHSDLIKLAKGMVLDRLMSDLDDKDKEKIKALLREKEKSDQIKQLTQSLKDYYPPAEVKTQLAQAFHNLLEEYTENILNKVNEQKKKKILAIIDQEESLAHLRNSLTNF